MQFPENYPSDQAYAAWLREARIPERGRNNYPVLDSEKREGGFLAARDYGIVARDDFGRLLGSGRVDTGSQLYG